LIIDHQQPPDPTFATSWRKILISDREDPPRPHEERDGTPCGVFNVDSRPRRQAVLPIGARSVEQPVAQHGATCCDHLILVSVQHRPGARSAAPGYALCKEP